MPSAEQMLQDAAWLKRLATTLANDKDDADDLVQESWIAAWRHQPDGSRPLRPWLAKVVRDLAGMKRRSDRRRAAREASADDAQAPAAPDELVEQMRLHRLLVDLVLELDEPYRSTVIARFVEGHTSVSIARSLGIPAGTVRKRLREALSRLRAGLGAKSGDRKRWAPAVFALTKGGVQVAKPTKLVLVLLAALLMSIATLVWFVLPRYPNSTSLGAGVPAATSTSTRSRVVPDELPAARVVVAVTDAAGPVADAAVRCATEGRVVVAQTGSDGTASVDLAAGEWSIAASAEGREGRELSTVTLAVVAGRDAHVALVLAMGGRTLTGRVTDASGGAIRGARIDAARLDANAKPGRAVAVAFTDSGGRYKLSVGGGLLLVAASHPDYAPQTRYVDLGPSGATANVALVPGGVIEGVVRDVQTKQPVAGAAVRARHDVSVLELAEANERVAKSDGDGKFRLAGLRPGAYELSAREGARNTRAPVRVGLGIAEQQTDIVVLIGPAATIRGKVVDETGAPAVAVTVRAVDGRGEQGNATSDDIGSFVLEGLAASRWMLQGMGERYLVEGHTLVDLKTSDVDGIVVRVRRGLEVRGHVEPRQVCDVALPEADTGDPSTRRESMTVTTSDSGDFRFAPLAPGKAAAAARCPNGDEGAIDVTVSADASEHIVPVRPGGSIAGRIIDTAGKPVVGVTVSAERTTDGVTMTTIVNSAVTSGFKAITSTGGAFEIRGLNASSYRLYALDRGRPMKTRKRFKVVLSTAQHATGVEIVVERPAGTIRGMVTDPDGAPVTDAWVALDQTVKDLLDSMDTGDGESRGVTIDGASTGDLPPVLSDASGHFELTNVPHGRYQVIAVAQSGKLRGRAADVTPDAEISIQLAVVGTLRGTVHGPRGPSDLFSVQLAGPTSAGRAFTDGTFEFPRVDPGDYTIEVTSSDGTGKATAHVSAGEVASVDISLVAKATVTGRLVDTSGKPLPGMSVALNPDRPPDQLSVLLQELPPASGPDGRFQVEGEAGRMMLVILGRPPMLKHGLSLEAGKTIDIGDVTLDKLQ